MPESDTITGDKTALSGLLRLAFGPVNDAVLLLAQIHELDPDSIGKLDLFSVSEIRQSREGCLEIKFYDRLKAFELLAVLSREREDSPVASSFYGALESAAKSACEAG